MPIFCCIPCCLWQANSLVRGQLLTYAVPVHRVFSTRVFYLLLIPSLLHIELVGALRNLGWLKMPLFMLD